MARKLTASDRKSLIRLASKMPKGSPERRAILAGLKKTAAPQPSSRGLFRLFTSRQGRITKVGEKPHSLSAIRSMMREFEKGLERLPDFGDDYMAEEGETLLLQSRVFGLKIDMDHGLSIFDTQTGESWAVGMDSIGYDGTHDPESYRPGARV